MFYVRLEPTPKILLNKSFYNFCNVLREKYSMECIIKVAEINQKFIDIMKNAELNVYLIFCINLSKERVEKRLRQRKFSSRLYP